MSQRRRHADDFTDSLNSFRYTSSSDIHSDTPYSMSQDSLDEIKARSSQKPIDVTRNSKHSIILAGSSTKNSLTLDTSVSSVTSMEPAPDLNKRINLFQSEKLEEQYQCNVGLKHSYKKIDDNKENNNPQCAMKDEQLESGVSITLIRELKSASSKEEKLCLHNVMSKSSDMDNNHNIHNNNSGAICIPEENVPKSITESEFFPLLVDTNKETHTTDIHEHEQVNDEQKKFESILCFLDNQLNRMKEVSEPRQIFRRLSDKYVDSPQNFTERLLTIIEESVINNEDNTFGPSAINLSRLTTEFRKMCKFIEDEAPPEWPPSPLSTPPCSEQVLASSACNRSLGANVHKNEKSLTSSANVTSLPATSLPATPLPAAPLSGIDVIRRRFFQKISKNNYNGSIDNVNNLSSNVSSTESFERLEAQCKRLFPEEKEYSHLLRKSSSLPSLLSMSQIQNICEKQMALLSDSNTVKENHREKTILSSPNLLDVSLYQSPLINKLELNCAKLQLQSPGCRKNVQREKVSYSKTKSIKINKQFDSDKPNGKKATYDYMTFDPDELEKTLLQDIAEKRRRCLDTARLISEINADPEAIEEQKSLATLSISTTGSESNSMSYDEAHFLKTLTSCKDYQTYLEKRKPLFNLLYKPSSFSTPKSTLKGNEKTHLKYKGIKDSKKEASNAKKTPSMKSNISTPKSTPQGNKDEKNKENTGNTKSKLFVTPGKSPQNANYKKKKLYFPNMYSPGKSKTENILKSPHAEGLYRLNYNTIISPVGMYIRGTDMQLIKNVRAKTDDLLLSPGRKNVKTTPNRNSKQTTPLQGITRTQKRIPFGINLSPKVGTNQAYKQEVITSKTPEISITPKSHFVLPKVSYKLPLQVKTIKENKSPKPGTRVEKLLEAAERKVIIRHQGRVNSIKNKMTGGPAGDTEILEINYEPEDESIHIEQAASKTNFIHKRKNI